MSINYDLDEMPPDLKKYIKLCKSAGKVFDHYFEKGDYFFHEYFGVDKVDKNTLTSFIYPSNRRYKIFNIPSEECIWLPTLNQVKEELKQPRIEEDEKHVQAVFKWCKKIDFE
jgi:hypothetical protein